MTNLAPAGGQSEGCITPQRVAQWRQQLIAAREALQQAYFAHGSAASLLRHHRKLVDDLLQDVWRAAAISDSASLLAVGGYGRGQMFPYSDVDLLILLPQAPGEWINRGVERLVGLFWDIGLEVGHSVRTLEECLDESARDVTVQTNLLETRFLEGSSDLFARLRQAIQDALDPRAFFDAKFLEQQQRHVRFHDTAYNLEPNLKESPGGLRDLQNILWISNACGVGTSWDKLAGQSIITVDEARQVRHHENFLENLRIRLHYLAKRREDRLLFDYQTALAHQLGLSDKGQRRASEQLMQRYYRTAKAVSLLNEILLQNLRNRIFAPMPAQARALNPRFRARDNLLEVADEASFQEQPSTILESFLLLQQHPELNGMTAATLRALWRAKDKIDPVFRRDPRNAALFMEILRQPRGITHALRRMNQYGVLGRYIPAFGRIVGQMQHDLFHVYTVDEHILMVVRNLRRFTLPEFAHEFPLCSRLINDFERPEVLYLAGLFHDIAKGRGGDHSRLGVRDARRFCTLHQIPKTDTEVVCWLVEHHLRMSATAQHQDLTDPDVIAAFAATARDERRLTALYLLTVADIRGTSPKVWNAWKGKLLEDLFHAALRHLRGVAPAPETRLQAKQAEALRTLRLYAIGEKAHEALWSKLDIGYFLRHEAQEIAWHTRKLFCHVDTKAPIVRARLSPIGQGLQVLIYTRDQPDLFARICGFFEHTDYNIVEAKINTTRHGYALDSFQVLDEANRSAHYRDLISYVEHELAQVLQQKTTLGQPSQGRVSRHLKHFPIQPEVAIRPDDKGVFHLLSITAGDRPGLLSRIARTLADHHIQVHTARIHTLGERAEDTFLVAGEPLAKTKALLRLETDLLQQLRT